MIFRPVEFPFYAISGGKYTTTMACSIVNLYVPWDRKKSTNWGIWIVRNLKLTLYQLTNIKYFTCLRLAISHLQVQWLQHLQDKLLSEHTPETLV